MSKKLIYKNFYFIQIFFSVLLLFFLSIWFILFKNNDLINNNSFLEARTTHNISKYNSVDNDLEFNNPITSIKSNPMNSDWDQKKETYGSYIERKFINEQAAPKNAIKIDNYYYQVLYTLIHEGNELINVEDVVKKGGNLTKELKDHVPFIDELDFAVNIEDGIIQEAKFTSKNNFKNIMSIKYKNSEGQNFDFNLEGSEAKSKNIGIMVWNKDMNHEWIIDYNNSSNPADPNKNGEYTFFTTRMPLYNGDRDDNRKIDIESFETDYNNLDYNETSGIKRYTFDFSFTLNYQKSWISPNKEEANAPFIINPSYMFSSSHFNSPGEWKYNRAPIWLDFYFINDDDTFELFDTHPLTDENMWEQDTDESGAKHKSTFEIKDFSLENKNFQGKGDENIMMEIVIGPLQIKPSSETWKGDTLRMSYESSMISMDIEKFPYYFNFTFNFSHLNVTYLANREYEFKFKTLILDPAKLPGHNLAYKIDDGKWEYHSFKFGTHEKNEWVDVDINLRIPNSENIKFGIHSYTEDQDPKYGFINPKIPLNTNIIFKDTNVKREPTGEFIVTIKFNAALFLYGQKLWWNEDNITGYNNFMKHFTLSPDGSSDSTPYFIKSTTENSINEVKIIVPIERSPVDVKENMNLSFELGYTKKDDDKQPSYSSTTKSFYNKESTGDGNKVELPKSPTTELAEMIKKIIILTSVVAFFIISAFSSGIALLIRSNKQTRMVINSLDDDVFNADDMEEDFELSL